MTDSYYYVEWGAGASIVRHDLMPGGPHGYMPDNENEFLSFEGAKAELLARLAYEIEALTAAANRIAKLTKEEVDEASEPRRPAGSLLGSLLGSDRMLPRDEDFTDRDMKNMGFVDPDDEEDRREDIPLDGRMEH
jgi:hypothetical protein